MVDAAPTPPDEAADADAEEEPVKLLAPAAPEEAPAEVAADADDPVVVGKSAYRLE